MQKLRPLLPLLPAAAALYGVNGVYQSYSSVYFASLGLDHAALGAVQAGVSLTALFALPFWGSRADGARDRRRTLRLMLAAAAAAAALYPLAGGLSLIAVNAALFSFFHSALTPVTDSVLLGELNALGLPLGPVRAAQTVSFALACALGGAVMGLSPHALPIMTVGLLGAALLGTLRLPPSPGGGTGPCRPLSLLKDGRLRLLLAAVFCLQVTLGFFYSFFPLYFTALPGGSRPLLGLAGLIGSVSELPLLLLGDRLFARLGTGRLLVLSAAVTALRWGILALFPSVPAAMASQLLQGGGLCLLLFAMAKDISLSVPPPLASSGQALVGMAGYGLARTLGALAGGWLSSLGLPTVFGLEALWTLAALAVLGIPLWRLKRPPHPGEDAGAARAEFTGDGS